MFASSQYPLLTVQPRRETRCAPQEGEGRGCDPCRRVTAALLLPHGRPGGWLLLLGVSCGYVLVQAVAQFLG